MTDKKKYMDDEEFDDTQPTGGAMPIDVEQAKAGAKRCRINWQKHSQKRPSIKMAG